MALGNAIVLNFSGGETSPRSRGRFDQPWYQMSARKMLNFIADLQGPARFRPGFMYLRQTRKGQVARSFAFSVNDLLNYQVELTPGYMRFYDMATQDLVVAASTTITGIANGVITVASATGIANGNELILNGIVGMVELNNRQVVVANLNGTSFSVNDPVTGQPIDTSGFGAYSSGGTVAVIYELACVYNAEDFPTLQIAATDGVAYFACPGQAPQKLQLIGTQLFSIGPYTRTNDPFAPAGVTLTVKKVYKPGATVQAGYVVPAGRTVISFSAGVPTTGSIYNITGVVGMTNLNGNNYRVVAGTINHTYSGSTGAAGASQNPPPYKPPTPPINVYWLETVARVMIDSSTYGTYTSGGSAVAAAENPVAVAFYEGCLWFGGTNYRPDCLFRSRGPLSTTGVPRYDDFTGGSNADNACFFQLAPTGGSASYISWLRGGPDHMFAGTFGGPYRISGSGLDIPVTPSSINVRQFDTAGCAGSMPAGLQQLFYVQRGGATIRSIKVINPYLATFEAADMCLNAEQVGYSPIQRVVLQRGRPDALWVRRADGQLSGMSVRITVQNADTLTGWHRHTLGGNGTVQDLSVVERNNGYDQIWAVVQRTVNGVQRCCIEVMADDVVFPDKEDFFAASGVVTAPSSDPEQPGTDFAGADEALWKNVLYRMQEQYIHLDSAYLYDGSARGENAGATLTPSAVGVPQVAGQAATTITLTASVPVFQASDVGLEVWVKPNLASGLGAGRVTITAFTSSTQVTVQILVPFSSVAPVVAGDWYFATGTFNGFGHLEGAQVAVVTDGAVFSDGGQTGDKDFPVVTVANGIITLPGGAKAGLMRAGFPYTGMLVTHNLELGGRTGPAQSKPRRIDEIYLRLMNTLGLEYGTDLYHMEKVDHRDPDAVGDRPAPVFSGIRRVHVDDIWSGLDDKTREKNVCIVQRLPLPAVVESIDINYETADEEARE